MRLKLHQGLLASCILLTASVAAGNEGSTFKPVTDSNLSEVPSGDWLGYRGNLANWAYSALDQIDAGNVAGLSLAWAWPLGAGTNETTPVVRDGILYVANPGGVVQALDARSGDLIWEYRRELPADVVKTLGHTRSLALYGADIFTVTPDAHLVALDAVTGAVKWAVATGDHRQTSQTTGPLVADGKVFTGRMCAHTFPGSCYILANDTTTGEELWRAHVVPRPGEAGDETWAGLPLELRRHVGAWGPGAYDPKLKLLYWGTSVPSPSNEVARGTVGGDMLYTNSTLALDADTGKIVWYFQHLPRDNWDMDHAYERILVDTAVTPRESGAMTRNPALKPGATRQVVTGIPGKTGMVWTLDRETGEFLWATETVAQNLIRDIDPNTGRVTINPDVIPITAGQSLTGVCPSNKGGKNWPPGAYSPRTNALYMPLQNTCMDIQPLTESPVPADGYGVLFNVYKAPDAEAVGELRAISVATGETLWQYQERAGMLSVLATGGGLVFAGNTDRRLRAFDESNGEVLWETVLQGPVTGSPITYAVNGTQYLAVTAGGGDWVSGDINTLAGLPTVSGTNMLFVFALPGNAAQRDQRIPDHRAITSGSHTLDPVFTAGQANLGEEIYGTQCAGCHGPGMIGTSNAPALTGSFFDNRWTGRPVAEFHDAILRTMPLNAPGSLNSRQATSLVAYWLELRGYQPGDQELPGDGNSLKQYFIQQRGTGK